MESRNYGYARISSKDQNLDRQLDSLKEVGVLERDIYIDKQSGKDFDRPGYKRLLDQLREDDTLFVLSLDRLGRNYNEIREQWELITHKLKADIVVLDMPLLDTRQNPGDLDRQFIADLTLQILAYVAERERASIRERQRQGIQAAKARGKQIGRPEIKRPENWEEVRARVLSGEITSVQAMQIMGLTKSTYYNLVKRENDPIETC